jgi:hypothetical protein
MYFLKRSFWSDLVERTASTAAQAALGVVTASAFGILDVASWTTVAAVAGTAGLVAVLKAFAVSRTNEDSEV